MAGLEELTEDDLALIASEVLAASIAKGKGPGDGHVLDLEAHLVASVWLTRA